MDRRIKAGGSCGDDELGAVGEMCGGDGMSRFIGIGEVTLGSATSLEKGEGLGDIGSSGVCVIGEVAGAFTCM